MTFTDSDRQGIGNIKRMLNDVIKTQQAHSKRFDVQAETLEGLGEQVSAHTELLGTVISISQEMVQILSGMDERFSAIEEKNRD